MTWIVGIDEAGYGPNLGPLVMTSVACRLPDSLAGADLWKLLEPAVRRSEEPPDGRFVVGDSKDVYSPGRGLRDLETSVLGILPFFKENTEPSLSRFGEWLCPPSLIDLQSEHWYTGTTSLPVEVESVDFLEASLAFTGCSQDRQMVWGTCRSVVVCAKKFNQLLKQWKTKGAVLGQAFSELLQVNLLADENGEAIHFLVDKHGGRNFYVPMVQDAVSNGFVIAHEESMQRSVYSIIGLQREIRLTFQPRADAEHFCVALASMISKYFREILMREFNQFWQCQVPGLKPTAGYPGDSARFYRAIKPAAQKLAIGKEALWRRK
jgi:ribonuclease HII